MRMVAALVTLLPALAMAQARPPFQRAPAAPVAVPRLGALGGSYASQGISRPLGGIAPPSYQRGAQAAPAQPPNSGYRYVGPVYYVPNPYGTYGTEVEGHDHAANAAYHPAYPPIQQVPTRSGPAGIQFSDAMQTQPQTVIVNQYFGKDEAPLPARTVAAATGSPEPAVSREYYLIAYKNRNVISALAYWLDGETLHYVTAANAHNQSSLSLIDLEMTTRLNADREVPFSVPGR